MKYIVTGRVHPERADVHFRIPAIKPPSGGSLSVHCEASQITVVLENQDVGDARSAFLMAEQIAQTFLSSLGFSLGTGYVVELIQVIEETGTVHVFGTRVEELVFEATETKFSETWPVCGEDIQFRMALIDYIFALRDPLRTASLCYRAIESIKSSFAGSNDSEKWAAMHLALATNRSEIDAVKAFADPIRHGNWANFKEADSNQRLHMLRVTRDILDHYLQWKLVQLGAERSIPPATLDH